eukprot:4205900-Amphidinium_carterae.1
MWQATQLWEHKLDEMWSERFRSSAFVSFDTLLFVAANAVITLVTIGDHTCLPVAGTLSGHGSVHRAARPLPNPFDSRSL